MQWEITHAYSLHANLTTIDNFLCADFVKIVLCEFTSSNFNAHCAGMILFSFARWWVPFCVLCLVILYVKFTCTNNGFGWLFLWRCSVITGHFCKIWVIAFLCLRTINPILMKCRTVDPIWHAYLYFSVCNWHACKVNQCAVQTVDVCWPVWCISCFQ